MYVGCGKLLAAWHFCLNMLSNNFFVIMYVAYRKFCQFISVYICSASGLPRSFDDFFYVACVCYPDMHYGMEIFTFKYFQFCFLYSDVYCTFKTFLQCFQSASSEVSFLKKNITKFCLLLVTLDRAWYVALNVVMHNCVICIVVF